MTKDTTSAAAGPAETPVFDGEGWFDPLEEAVRGKVRTFIEAILEEELKASLSRKRYERHRDGQVPAAVAGHRHGHRERTLTGTFGVVSIRVPRARLETAEGGTREWKSTAIPAYQRRTRQAEALIAGLICRARTRDACAERLAPCSVERSARTSSAGLGARWGPTGKPGTGAIYRPSRLCG